MRKIGITMGDVAGIGPEIILKALQDRTLLDRCIVYGSIAVLQYYIEQFHYQFELNKITPISKFKKGMVNVKDCCEIGMNDFQIGQVNPASGKAAFLYLENAIKDALNQDLDAIVTAPLNKEALHLAGYHYPGHTEILAELTHTKSYAMLLWSNQMKVIHVSTHCSLLQACQKVKKERIIQCIQLANDTLSSAKIPNYRIAVAGLNPHASENGIFGEEEKAEILPAVQFCQKQGINVIGPLPPDTIFLRCFRKEFDLVVAMYHDQGHIPLKLMAFEDGVNITVGLPFVRTSVDHGTAFDIAGKNIADEKSMLQAIKVAELLIQ